MLGECHLFGHTSYWVAIEQIVLKGINHLTNSSHNLPLTKFYSDVDKCIYSTRGSVSAVQKTDRKLTLSCRLGSTGGSGTFTPSATELRRFLADAALAEAVLGREEAIRWLAASSSRCCFSALRQFLREIRAVRCCCMISSNADKESNSFDGARPFSCRFRSAYSFIAGFSVIVVW